MTTNEKILEEFDETFGIRQPGTATFTMYHAIRNLLDKSLKYKDAEWKEKLRAVIESVPIDQYGEDYYHVEDWKEEQLKILD